MIALGGQPGEREMVLTRCSTSSASAGLRPIASTASLAIGAPVPRDGHQRLAACRCRGRGRSAARVSRPINPSEVTLCLCHGLHQVPVHGVSMDRIVLRSSANRLPRRNPSADAAGEVERLPDRLDIGPGGTACPATLSARLRPRRRQRLVPARLGCQPLRERGPARAAQRGPQPGDQRGIAGAGPGLGPPRRSG